MFPRPVCLRHFLVAIAIFVLGVSARAQEVVPGIEKVWERDFGIPLAGAASYTVYNLNLVAGVNQRVSLGESRFEDSPHIYRLSLGGDPMTNEPEEVSTTGLPLEFKFDVIEINPFTQDLIAAGMTGDSPAVFVAGVTPKIELAEFRRVELPEGFAGNARFHTIRFIEEYTLLFAMTDGGMIIGAAANFGAPPESFRWIEIPSPPARIDGSILATGNRVIHVAGRYPDPSPEQKGKPSSYPDELIFEKPNFISWHPLALPIDRHMTDTVGTCYGSVLVCAPRNPRALVGDEATTTGLYLSLNRGEESLSLWSLRELDEPPEFTIQQMVIDPGNSHLLVISRHDNLKPRITINAYELPIQFTARPKSEEDRRIAMLERHAASPESVSLEEVLRRARENGQLALIVVSSGDRMEDLSVRGDMASSRYRYSTLNVQSTYLKGEEGRSVLDEYGIQETPAYLLVDADGKVIRRHVGSVPDPPQLFELTTPSRSPIEDSPELETLNDAIAPDEPTTPQN